VTSIRNLKKRYAVITPDPIMEGLSELVQAVTLWEMSDSNFGWDTDYPE
jgi:hypothetical protein